MFCVDEITVVVVLDRLLFGFGSVVDDDTLAALTIEVPDAVPAGTLTTIVNVVEAPEVIEASEHETRPVAPTAGVLHPVQAVPDCANDANVTLVGSESTKIFEAAAAGPLFFTTIEYVIVPLGLT